jgi:alkylation response protein AidB-like acyl-CoA dehydrogenase
MLKPSRQVRAFNSGSAHRQPHAIKIYCRTPSAEGNLNAAQLVARCGTYEQRGRRGGTSAAGHLFGLWNTQDEGDALRIARAGGTVRLSGARTWASSAGSITRPVVTAAWPDGGVQMCLLRMDEIDARMDASAWQPLGMHASDSFRVALDGVALAPFDFIGEPGGYERQPWFFAGALRFGPVHTGIAERVLDETVNYLRTGARDSDPFQCRCARRRRHGAHR